MLLRSVLAIAVFLVSVHGRLCNSTDPSDVPFSTGCDFCNENITNGFNGCFNGGICYRQVRETPLFFFFFFFSSPSLPLSDPDLLVSAIAQRHTWK